MCAPPCSRPRRTRTCRSRAWSRRSRRPAARATPRSTRRLFSIADAPLPDLDVTGLEIVPDESPGNGSAKAEINVVVVNHDGRGEAPAEPTIIWEYNSDLFSAATAERMVAGLLPRPRVAPHGPRRPRLLPPLLAESERNRLLVEWNDTAADYPRDATIDDVFTAVAEGDPDTSAVAMDGETITYGELDRRSNQLARHLRARGVVQGSRVGISTERSLEMVVGLLGSSRAAALTCPSTRAIRRSGASSSSATRRSRSSSTPSCSRTRRS